MTSLSFIVYSDPAEYWRWHLEDDDGVRVAVSDRAYRTVQEAEADVFRILALPSGTRVIRR